MKTHNLKAALKARAEEFCRWLYEAGRREGSNYLVGSLAGESGKSLKICIEGPKAGVWRDFAGGPGDKGGNLLDLLMHAHKVGFAEACRQARAWLGWPPIEFERGKSAANGTHGNPVAKFHKFNWSACVKAMSAHALAALSEWRGLTPAFCQWLLDKGLVGLDHGCFAFPVQNDDNEIIGCHLRRDDGSWRYDPPGIGVRPLIFGEVHEEAAVFVFESQWDAFAVADKLGMHQSQEDAPKRAFIVTRGASNGPLVQGRIPAGCSLVFAFPQNDEEKNGCRAGEQWLEKVVSNAQAPVRRVEMPAVYKDANDWTRAGATTEVILAAMNAAKAVPKTACVDLLAAGTATTYVSLRANGSPPAEFAELVVLARNEFAARGAASANSTNSTGDNVQPAVFPPESILATWMKFARAQEESADAFLIGAILPVCAAILARQVYFRWGARRIFPNVFVMLTGKPGDRKSSCILLAENLARLIIPTNAFLPASFSPEAMFNEYYEDAGGRPDKLWIVDDANATLKDWQKSVNGERVATRFLELYDCKSLSENFQRNRKESEDGEARRVVEQTSTSLLFGATFNIAAFQGQEVRAGMSRRFLYYVAARHGRLIVRPSANDDKKLVTVSKGFKKLLGLSGEMDFAPEAAPIWQDYQQMNRDEMDAVDPLREAELSRLSSAPMQTLSMAMIFEACCWARSGGPWSGQIQADTLVSAIDHVNACLEAAKRLDATANQAEIGQEAEIFLAKVRHDFSAYGEFHFASRSELTKQYCPNSGRARSWKPDDLYLRFIPLLERRREVVLAKKEGKREIFAFRSDSEEKL